ncbi:M56 family metallopeptidase [Zongyangia hominis]|uniref:M56 family metallopeptidase n=1 Tax=Zongyangia hominis TaxID=2763677 RepID=A0A926IBM4_9FIRM|nr:M56 family metallopeptidase [Zongyangia hominis]MBC8571396.1 M56 family metallopeptidase [Zongyangia hominis]
MLEQVFLQILNMAFTASFVILLVMVARLFLKRAPKIYSYALWSVVLFRLTCPFSFESVLSLLPTRAKPIPVDIMQAQAPRIDTGIRVLDRVVNPVLPAPAATASVNPMQVWIWTGAVIWLTGIAVLFGYSLWKFFRMRSVLKGATLESGNVYLLPGLDTPFVVGLFRPKIYLPTGLTEVERRYILLHERAHIHRGDHVVKFVSFLLVCAYWFHPLVWAAFFLSGKDMEMSCDENVIKRLGSEAKRGYSSTLLSMATGRRVIGGTPLAFGEGDTKGRIKNVLRYKKPAFWVALIALLVVAGICVGLLTNPKEKGAEQVPEESSSLQKTALSTDEISAKAEQTYPGYVIEADGDETVEGQVLARFRVSLPPVEGDQAPSSLLAGVNKVTGEVLAYDATKNAWNPAALHYSEEAYIQAVLQSATFEDGTVSVTIPQGMPERYALSMEVRGLMPLPDGSHMSLHAFEQESLDNNWVQGKTYREKMFDETVPDSTELSVYVSFYKPDAPGEHTGIVRYWDQKEWVFTDGKPVVPVSLSDTVVQVTSEQVGGKTQNATLTYTEADGHVFRLQAALPSDWSLRLMSADERGFYGPVAVYRGEERIGVISYSDFEIYEGTTEDNFYRMVYNRLMLGSMANWDNEYTPVNQTDTTCTATCRVYHREGDASGEVWYSPGILAYNTDLLRYIVIDLAEGSATQAEVDAIARSIVLR